MDLLLRQAFACCSLFQSVDANEAYARSASRASAIGYNRSTVSEEDRRKRGGFFLPRWQAGYPCSPLLCTHQMHTFSRWTKRRFFATMKALALTPRALSAHDLKTRPSFGAGERVSGQL